METWKLIKSVRDEKLFTWKEIIVQTGLTEPLAKQALNGCPKNEPGVMYFLQNEEYQSFHNM